MGYTTFHSTTICAVEKNGKFAMAGDGQVTMGESVVMKGTAKKVRRIYNGEVVVGFAGSVADAFNLEEKFADTIALDYTTLPTGVSHWTLLFLSTKLGSAKQ